MRVSIARIWLSGIRIHGFPSYRHLGPWFLMEGMGAGLRSRPPANLHGNIKSRRENSGRLHPLVSYDDDGWVSRVASASGVQLGSGRPCHHSLGRPLPTNGTPCSQRISSSPLSTPLADTSAGFPKMAPGAPPGALGGRWTSRNGRGDALAARRHPRVNADSETRSATGGSSTGAVGAS